MNQSWPSDVAADARCNDLCVEVDAPATSAIGLAPGFNGPVELWVEETTEQRLVRAGDGEQRAFAQVYDATSPRVFGLVLRIVMDRAHAEEVTREVYVEAWRHATRFDPERSTALTWLLQIAHSHAVDRVRASRTPRSRHVRIGVRDAPMPIDAVSQRTETSAASVRACPALATLSVLHREAIELAYFHGFTRTDIAERVGVPPSTVTTRLRDGMTGLRPILV